MSWLFGYGKPPVSPPPGAPEPPKNPKDDENIQSKMIKTGAYSFDSESLERAAQSAKYLEQSKYAKEAFNLSKEQEKTKQIEYQKEMKEYELQLEHWKTDQYKIQEDEKRRRLQEEARLKQESLNYQDKLARQREEDMMQQQRRFQQEQLQKQEQSILKQEEMKRKTAQYEAELAHKNAMELMEAKHRGKAKAERENHTLRMEKLRASAVENRLSVNEYINNALHLVGNGIENFLNDKTKVATVVVGVTATVAGIRGFRSLFKFVDNRIGKPSLVRETSRLNATDLLRQPIKTIKARMNRPEDPLSNIVLDPKLEDRLRRLAIATRQTRANKGYYRNALLHGPPGTGKTFYAKSLAIASNMDYAIISGGDVTPLGERGVTEMHKLFNWANTSRRGLMLFIDEADAFLYKRNQVQISESLRSTLNAFLQRTGEQSKNCMVVFASNAPQQFDWAINSRIDEVVEFPLPNLEERIRLMRQYFYEYIMVPASNDKHRIKLESKPGLDWEAKCNEIAQITEGLSGRDIVKIAVNFQSSTYSSNDGVLTEEMVDKIVGEALEGYNKKEEWRHYKLGDDAYEAQGESMLHKSDKSLASQGSKSRNN